MTVFKPSNQMVFETVVEDMGRLRVFLSKLDTSSWTFDLSEVKRCDSAGVALLVEAKRLSQLSQCQCELQGMSAEIDSLIEFCGVKQIMC